MRVGNLNTESNTFAAEITFSHILHLLLKQQQYLSRFFLKMQVFFSNSQIFFEKLGSEWFLSCNFWCITIYCILSKFNDGEEYLVLLDVINGGYGWFELLMSIVGYIVLVLVMLPVHELAHAFVATKLGDETPRWHGRLTLNPFAHLDLWGTMMLVLFGFGYAKPVPVNPRNFKNPRRDMALVALAGPVSNLLMAVVVLLLFRLLKLSPSGTVLIIGATLVNLFVSINIGLAVFNLLPIPPLDGSRIFSSILPPRWAFWMSQHEHQIRLILIVLLATGALSTPIHFLSSRVYQILLKVCGF